MKTYKLLIVALLLSFCCSAQMYLEAPAVVQAVKLENMYTTWHMYALGSKLIFTGGKVTTGTEWYSYDGNNTVTAAPELAPGTGHGIKTPMGDQRTFAAILNGVIYFSGVDYTSGNEVFKWDGISSPQLVKDIVPGSLDAQPSGFCTTDDKLYFTADSVGPYRNIHEYDPITNSITAIKKNLTFTALITTHNNKLYYQIGNSTIMYEYNPQTKQTKMIGTPCNNNNNFVGYGSKLFYTCFASGGHLNYYDGNTSNTISTSVGAVTDPGGAAQSWNASKKTIIACDGKIYFWRTVNSVRNLYYYDTTTNLVQQAPGLKPFYSTEHFFFLEHQNKIYYSEGSMLVRYDGTKADTMLPFNFDGYTMAVFNNEIYMTGRGYGADVNMLYRLKDTLVPYTPPATVQAVTFNADVTLYPNPAGNMATLSMNLLSQQTLTATITDITGKVVHSTQPTLYSTGKTEMELPLQNLSPGNYVVSLKDSGGNMLWSGKLVHQ